MESTDRAISSALRFLVPLKSMCSIKCEIPFSWDVSRREPVRIQTPSETDRKLVNHFKAGVELVWIVDPKTRTATVYTSPSDCTHVMGNQTLTGGTVLPGFKLKLKSVFAVLDAQ